ncbi:hypothetical protein GJ744_005195 [Endocarpon pusillum]|uniref:Uncharacterized protein n=1 Tax=Endocarpon pusillum TaxID=364733 RepID=A0A8H7A900_9EURO|nr:hypothetical protein GJ744_005195 [Endocarpon pusillum]
MSILPMLEQCLYRTIRLLDHQTVLLQTSSQLPMAAHQRRFTIHRRLLLPFSGNMSQRPTKSLACTGCLLQQPTVHIQTSNENMAEDLITYAGNTTAAASEATFSNITA